VHGQHVFGGVVAQQFERLTFVEMPDFIGVDAMPATEFSGGEQEIDRCRDRALRAVAVGDARRRFVDAS
jgi:hypothetical protein